MKKSKAKRVKTLVDVARLNGLTYQRVHRAFSRGVFAAGADGLFDAVEAGRLIRDAEADGKNGSVIASLAAKQEHGGIRSELIKQDERWRRMRASLAEIELLEKRGELVSAKDVEAALIRRELEFKDRLSGLPHEVAPVLAKMTPRQIESYLHAKITEIFKCLARPKDAAKFRAEFKAEADAIANVG